MAKKISRAKKANKPIFKYLVVSGFFGLIIILGLIIPVSFLTNLEPVIRNPKASGGEPVPYWFHCDWDGDKIYTQDDSDKLEFCIFNHSKMHYNCPKTDINADEEHNQADLTLLRNCMRRGMSYNPLCSRGDYNGNGRIDAVEYNDTGKCIKGIYGFGGYSRRLSQTICAKDPNRDIKLDAGDFSYCTLKFRPMPTPKPPSVAANCNMCDFDYDYGICSDEINDKLTNGCIFKDNPSLCYIQGDPKRTIIKGDCNKDNKIDAGDVSCCVLCANVAGNGCKKTPTPTP